MNGAGALPVTPMAPEPGSMARGSTVGTWRLSRPVLVPGACRLCLDCTLFCPDSARGQAGDHIEINYDFCKGCGICARECRAGAVVMRPEEGM